MTIEDETKKDIATYEHWVEEAVAAGKAYTSLLELLATLTKEEHIKVSLFASALMHIAETYGTELDLLVSPIKVAHTRVTMTPIDATHVHLSIGIEHD